MIDCRTIYECIVGGADFSKKVKNFPRVYSDHFLHFLKKRLKILKNVSSKNVLVSIPQNNSSHRLLNVKNRLLLVHSFVGYF
jgi:hypothetical protein